jgi:hypothetical protein
VKEHHFVMLFVDGGKLYYLHKHYKYLSRRESLQAKVLLAKRNALKLKEGFHYLTEPL